MRGRNPSKQKRSVGQPGQGQRGQHRGGAGDGGDVQAGGDGAFDQPEARVGDGRHAGVGHHHQGLSGAHQVQQFGGLGRLVVLVVADDPAGDA